MKVMRYLSFITLVLILIVSGSSSVSATDLPRYEFDLVDVTPADFNFSPSDFCIQGNYAYIANGYNGLDIFDIANEAKPVRVNRLPLGKSVNWIEVKGDYAYVVVLKAEPNSQLCLDTIDISNPEEARVISELEIELPVMQMAIFGEFIYMEAGYYNDAGPEEWAFLTVGISNPEMPELISSEDIKTYESPFIVKDGIGYFAAWGWGLKIFDLVNPGAAKPISMIEVDEYAEDIDVSGDYIYLTRSKPGELSNSTNLDENVYFEWDYFLDIFKITPEQGAGRSGSVRLSGPGRNVKVVGNTVYILGYDGHIDIADVTDPDNPVLINEAKTELVCEEVDVIGDKLILAGDDGFFILGLTDPSALPIYGFAISTGYAHLAGISGSLLLAQTGHLLALYDIDPPGGISLITTLKPGGHIDCATLYDELLLFVSNNNLNICDISNPSAPELFSSLQIAGDAIYSITVKDDLVYLCIDTGEKVPVTIDYNGYPMELTDSVMVVQILDISDPYFPKNLQTISFRLRSSIPNFISVSGGYAYLSCGWGGFFLLDIDPLEESHIIGEIEHEGAAEDSVVSRDRLYVACWGDGIQVFDISHPSSIERLGKFNTKYFTDNLDFSDGYVFAAKTYPGISVIDARDPNAMEEVTAMAFPIGADKVIVNGDYAYVMSYASGIHVIKLNKHEV